MEPARSRRLALALVFILLALSAGIVFAKRSGTDYRVYSNDFNVYYFASRQILAGHGPYDTGLGPWTPYLYTPLLAELMAPLALAPLPAAAYLWYLINLASFIVAVRMAVSLTELNKARASNTGGPPPVLHKYVVGIGASIILGRFILDSFAMGQVNLLITCLAIGHVDLYSRNRKGLSALALALACVLKITPLVFLIYHLFRARWKYVMGTGLLTVAIGLASFAVLGTGAVEGMSMFYSRTIRNGQGFDLSFSGNQSLRGAESRILHQSDEQSRKTTDPWSAALSGALVLFAGWKLISEGRNTTSNDSGAIPEGIAAAPFFCLAVMSSPLGWKNHFVILLLPIAILIRQAVTWRAEVRTSAAPFGRISIPALGAIVALVCFDLTSPILIGNHLSEWADSHSVVFLATLAIYSITLAWRSTLRPAVSSAGART